MIARLRGANLEIPPWYVWSSNLDRNPDRGQCMVGSLTGAVSSQRVTEERKGTLSTVGHRTLRAKA